MESIYVPTRLCQSSLHQGKASALQDSQSMFFHDERQGLAAPKVVLHGPESKVLKLFSYSEGKVLGIRIIILTISNERMYISVNEV